MLKYSTIQQGKITDELLEIEPLDLVQNPIVVRELLDIMNSLEPNEAEDKVNILAHLTFCLMESQNIRINRDLPNSLQEYELLYSKRIH